MTDKTGKQNKSVADKITILIKNSDYDPYVLLKKHQEITTKVGAQSVFIGYMRDFRDDNLVDEMNIEYYPEMTEYQINKIAVEIVKTYKLESLFISHRVGKILPNQAIVVISSLSSHRKNSIVATEKTLEILKHRVPFWKKETHKGRNSWVDKNTKNKLT